VLLVGNLPSLHLQQNPAHLITSVLKQRHFDVASSPKGAETSLHKLFSMCGVMCWKDEETAVQIAF
jgi:hypothetical protein